MPKLPTFLRATLGAALIVTTSLIASAPALAAVAINNFFGPWNSTVTYPKGSVVTSGGSSYISLLGSAASPNVNHSPLISSKWWSPFAAQGSQGLPGAPGPAGGMVVKDSTGKVVGPYIFTAYDNESVAVKTSGGTLVFGLTATAISSSGEPLLQFTSSHFLHLYYATANCTGVPYTDPYMSTAGDINFRYQFVSGTSFYSIPPPSTAVETIIEGSYRSLSGCWASSNSPMSVIALTSGTPISSLGFVAPFTIQLN